MPMPTDKDRATQADALVAKAKHKIARQRDKLAQSGRSERPAQERILDLMKHNASAAEFARSLNTDGD